MNSVALSGGLMLIILVVLLAAGAPIAVFIGIASVAGILPTLDLVPAVITGAQRMFTGISVFTLLAIPFFILAGNIMNRGGIAIRLINLAKLAIGMVPGGLALTNILANMMFGAVSGSGIAAASAMGTIIGPRAKEAGYDVNYTAATNVASAPTGLLIPPSNVLITYSLISGGTSVAALFVAGYVPGILWGVGCMIVAYLMARKRGYRGEAFPGTAEALNVIWRALPSLLLIVIVIGGIVKGVFTATEGSCIAVVYALLLSMVYRSMTWGDFVKLTRESAETTGIIMLLIGASSIMGWVMSFTRLPEFVSGMLLGVTESEVGILLIINVILLLVGTFMDITPAVLIFTPIFLPICMKFGMSPVQFGIMITYNLCIGGITPPVGNMLYVGTKMGGTKVEAVLPVLVKYYLAILLILLMVTFIPGLSTWLPKSFGLM